MSELGRLPERQRSALVDTALNGRAHADVAVSMGISEHAVRQLVHRARTTLRGAVTAITPWPPARWLATPPSATVPNVAVPAGVVSSSREATPAPGVMRETRDTRSPGRGVTARRSGARSGATRWGTLTAVSMPKPVVPASRNRLRTDAVAPPPRRDTGPLARRRKGASLAAPLRKAPGQRRTTATPGADRAVRKAVVRTARAPPAAPIRQRANRVETRSPATMAHRRRGRWQGGYTRRLERFRFWFGCRQRADAVAGATAVNRTFLIERPLASSPAGGDARFGLCE
jgi:hypothetical protein